jgi:hypothetical protein
MTRTDRSTSKIGPYESPFRTGPGSNMGGSFVAMGIASGRAGEVQA